MCASLVSRAPPAVLPVVACESKLFLFLDVQPSRVLLNFEALTL